MMNKLYTIIVTYNAMKWIEKCLHCLDSSILHSEIVVVDNCSTDGTIGFIEDNYPRVHIIKNSKNRGFGQANNQGIEYAYKEGATHFFLCNQDLYVEPNSLNRLVEEQNKSGLYIASPLQMNGSFELFDQSFFNVFVKSNNLYVSNLLHTTLSSYYEAKFVPAAAWMMSRDCIESIGGFDPLFFHYGEDSNYLRRLLYHHKKVGIVPDVMVAHDREYKGNVKLFNKNAPLSSLLILYSDPSYNLLSFSRDRIMAHLVIIRDLMKYLFSFKLKSFFDLLILYFSFWMKLRKIVYSIKTNRRINNNWLNI